jgi:hypothetical protein
LPGESAIVKLCLLFLIAIWFGRGRAGRWNRQFLFDSCYEDFLPKVPPQQVSPSRSPRQQLEDEIALVGKCDDVK